MNPAFVADAGFGPATSSSPISATIGAAAAVDVSHLPPLLPFEKHIVAHAIMYAVVYLVARLILAHGNFWLRIALPIIVTGVALGITAVQLSGVPAISDTHMRWGIAIFVLYLFQLSLGTFIHFVKTPALARKGARAPQNYFHAVLGIFIIGIAFYQVRTGFRTEWPLYTGRGSVGNGANIVWIIWLVLIPIAYFSGMILLRRQYRQEQEAAKQRYTLTQSGGSQVDMNMTTRNGGSSMTQ
ncbi:hypothetical protein NM688_g7770 [Phlebia brevispora]|uniref:Uncharacterized protein n=1 Tax=Phlebia brevispora TaxID=194682 RepID=A0ACC1S1B1_9APHY|nr:hypothetical protein NM688_g7770 [Phlebia brevispora]